MVLCQVEVSELVNMDTSKRYVITSALFAFSM